MAMGKAILDPARGVTGSSIVTAMCRNGTDFGIRVAGLGERWFTAPVEMPQGLIPGYSEADANPDIGDSAILEAVGLGAFAMAAAPRWRASSAPAASPKRSPITLDGRDCRRAQPDVAHSDARIRRHAGRDRRAPRGRTGIAPAINTGIAHRLPGVGQVGAGVARAPLPASSRR